VGLRLRRFIERNGGATFINQSKSLPSISKDTFIFDNADGYFGETKCVSISVSGNIQT